MTQKIKKYVDKRHSARHQYVIPEVRVTIEAHEAERAASLDATFCRERSSVFCFHFSEA